MNTVPKVRTRIYTGLTRFLDRITGFFGQWGVLGTHCPQNVVFAAVACHRPPAALSEVFLEASFCENFDRVHRSSYDDPQMVLRLAESEFPIDDLQFGIGRE
mgnify:CR=1 FL=1